MAHRAILGEAGGFVVRAGGRVVVIRVAAEALGDGAGELTVDMALRALHADMRAGERERRLGVIELRALPLCGGVADRAILRELARHVLRIGRVLEIGQMAPHALRRSAGEDSVDVALRALHRSVGPGQRELGEHAVVEFGPLPLHGRMTDRAILGEPAG